MPFLLVFLYLFDGPLSAIDMEPSDYAAIRVEVEYAPLSWVQSPPQPVLP